MRVAVAVIVDESERVLITQRSPKSQLGGFWEFPGGKLEAGEQAEHALIREIKEEVDLDIIRYEPLCDVSYDYSGQLIHLHVFKVNDFQGKAARRESQTDLRWVALSELSSYHFPPANQKILEHLGL